jgi:5'-AMP-activated protein kinase, catalytic alpha subunit
LEWTICLEALKTCHSKLGEKVAVKILEKSRVKEQADIKRVNREIKILKRARHGNVIQLYEVIDTPTAIYLMMENAEG